MFRNSDFYHRFFKIGFCVTVLVFAAPSGAAAQPAAEKPPAGAEIKVSVKRLIRDLGSSSRRVRVRAERELFKLGPRVLPLLPPPELVPTVSVREAVRRVRIRLERSAARDSVKPSFVVLKGEQTLREVLQSVVRQTGNRIDFTRLPRELLARRVAMKAKRRTFWSIVGELSRGNR
ncbi:MAG: hypothetical protein IH933_15980, partial [Euryarchaeota archaeon]|nr:hypothetical protein [Euryarchaeota archaeon]